MDGAGREGDRAEIGRMQAAVRAWVLRTSGSARGLRGIPPPVLLSLLCASAFSPLLAVGAGLGAAAVAGMGVLSSVSGGALSGIIADAVDRARSKDGPHRPAPAELEGEIAREIGQVLAAGDANAQALRAEIATVLEKIDAGGTVLRAVMEQGNDRIRGDVIAAISGLGSGFAEMGFLIKDVTQAAAEIQKSLDMQGADVRAIIEQNDRQSTDIRLVREDLAVIALQARAGVSASPPGDDGRPRWVHGCPYRGLLPFEETNAEVFYGRERLTAELAVTVAAQMTRGGLVVVTGASGAGKSSLLRAGLMPALARGQQVAGSAHWPRIAFTPTKDPLTELATRLAALGGSDTVAVRDRLAQHPGQAHMVVRQAVVADAARREAGRPVPSDGAARLVLIVDQFEQIFTLNPGLGGETERQAFITALRTAATNPAGPEQEPPALLVIAVRGDFWDRCAAYPELAVALKDGQFVVGPMTESDLRLTITGPADAAGLRIDPALTDTILSDLRAAGGGGATGVLPLLSQAMALTWERREGNRLTSHGYGQAGGVSHAVQTSADDVYDALSAGQQTLAREVLRSMTVASRDGRLTRRPVIRADLYAGHPDADQVEIDAVLEAFAAQRLIVLNEGTVEISHDVLLSAWPRLRGWLEDDRASWILHGQLTADAAAWRDRHDDASFLYRGTRLIAVQQAATRWSANPARYPALTGTQRDFLRTSERAATRSTRQRRSAVAALAVLALLALIASAFAFQQRAIALGQRDQAIYNQTIAEALQLGTSNISLAAQLNLAAYGMRKRPAPDLTSRLLSAENTPLSTPLTGHTGPVDSVAFSPDHRTLASGNDNGTIHLWDVADPAHPQALGQLGGALTVVNRPVDSVAFSPDGRTLASGNRDGTVRLWDVADPAHPHVLGQLGRSVTGDTLAVYSVAFSHDDLTLASGNRDGTVRLWYVADPAHPHVLGQLGRPVTKAALLTDAVFSVAFSRDDLTLASGNGDDTVRLWDVTDPAHPHALGQPLTGHTDIVDSVAFSPDGRTLASGSLDNTVRLWDVADPAHPRPLGQPLTGHTYIVYSVAFSPDGRTLASGSFDNTVRLWDVADPAHPRPLGQPLTGGIGAVYSVAFSPDGRTVASGSGSGGSGDGTVRLWSLPRTVLIGHAGTVSAVAFSRDGRTLASGGYDSTVRLWDVADPVHPRPLGQPLTGNTGLVLSVAFSRDGRMLASGGSDGAVRLWDVTDPVHPHVLGQLGRPVTKAALITHAVFSVAFSRDGRTLATGSYDATVLLWDVADPAHPHVLGRLGRPLTGDVGPVYSVAFSPDGRTLASGRSDDDTVRLWDVADPVHPQPLGRPLTANTGPVFSVAFSPDGRTLASGSAATVLWDVANPAHPRLLDQPLIGGVGAVQSVAFSPDGRTLASGSYDGTVLLWDVADPAHALGQPLTGSTNIVYSVAFSPRGGMLAAGGDDDTIRLWNLKVSYAIDRICTTTRNNLTPQQWHKYLPQLPYQPPCAH